MAHEEAGMDRVIEVALADLSERVNTKIGLIADRDKRAAVDALAILDRAGYVFTRLDVEHWALAHGWDPLAAIGLGAIVEGVIEGWPFQLTAPGPTYPAGILATWEERARG
jgi:hypothetical protein